MTPIDVDHVPLLGKTLQEIAREKAGIIKPGVPMVSAPQRESAREVIQQTARERRCELIWSGERYRAEIVSRSIEGWVFDLRGRKESISNLLISILGDHQVINAVTAVVIGGVALTGGVGTVLGVVGGVLVIGLLGNIMTLAGWGSFDQMIAKGCLFVIVVGAMTYAARRGGRDDE